MNTKHGQNEFILRDICVFLGVFDRWIDRWESKSDVPEDIQPSVDLPEDEGPDMKNASRNPSTGNDNEDVPNGTMDGGTMKIGELPG